MTIHVYCPIAKKWFDFESIPHARRFVMGIMRKQGGHCKKKITIRKGDTMLGRMWKVGPIIVWKGKGVSYGREVLENGELGDRIELTRRKRNGNKM